MYWDGNESEDYHVIGEGREATVRIHSLIQVATILIITAGP